MTIFPNRVASVDAKGQLTQPQNDLVSLVNRLVEMRTAAWRVDRTNFSILQEPNCLNPRE